MKIQLKNYQDRSKIELLDIKKLARRYFDYNLSIETDLFFIHRVGGYDGLFIEKLNMLVKYDVYKKTGGIKCFSTLKELKEFLINFKGE